MSRSEAGEDHGNWLWHRLVSSLGLGIVPRSRQPGAARWILASILAIGLSLLACRGIALAAFGFDPLLAGYGHLQFGDYSRLVILGVAAACVAWRVVAAVSARARFAFLILAILVTVVGFAPDVWILHLGQPPAGVEALVAMHLALALITYPVLVLVSPQRRESGGITLGSGSAAT